MTLDQTITAYSTQWPFRDHGGPEMAAFLRTCDAVLREHDLEYSTSHTTLWIICDAEKRKQTPSRWIGVFADGSNYELWLSSRRSDGTISENKTTQLNLDDAATALQQLITELVS